MEENRKIGSSSVERRWEDLNTDCLIKVFEKVGLESLIIDIPFVCKSWYKASLDPLLYQVLHFEFMSVEERTTWATITAPQRPGAQKKYSKLPPSTGFVKIAVKRSCRMATEVVIPEFLDDYSIHCHFNLFAQSYATLVYVLEWCPALKTLIVPYYSFFKDAGGKDERLVEMISKLKHLQSIATLTVGPTPPVVSWLSILNQIHINCQNFESLSARGILSSDFASTIVTLFPNIKHLVLKKSSLFRDDLICILSGCRKLELLDVTNSIRFHANDAMILKLASHIEIFKWEGSSIKPF